MLYHNKFYLSRIIFKYINKYTFISIKSFIFQTACYMKQHCKRKF